MQAIARKVTGLINLPLYKKQGGYMLWALAEQAMTLGLPRLVLFPLAAYLIGKDQFGAFVMAMSITYMVGFHPALGLSIGMLRQLSGYEADQQKLFCSTAAQMSSRAMVAVVAVGLLAAGVAFAVGLIEPVLFHCLIPLIVALYPENQFFLNLTELRINRKFGLRVGWYAIRSVLLVAFGVGGAIAGGAVGFAWGYVAGNAAAFGVLLFHRAEWLKTGYDRAMAAKLKEVWLHITVAGIIAASGPYLNKIILGFYHEYSEVADLFAATAIFYAFMLVAGCIGNVLSSVLARYRTMQDLPRIIRYQFLFVAAVVLTVLPVIFKAASPFVFGVIFPTFGPEAERLLDIVFWAIPFAGLISFAQPFVIKFASIKIVPLVNGLTLVGTIVPAILLIPSMHAAGAAWGIVIGQSFKGLLWAGFAIRLHLKKN